MGRGRSGGHDAVLTGFTQFAAELARLVAAALDAVDDGLHVQMLSEHRRLPAHGIGRLANRTALDAHDAIDRRVLCGVLLRLPTRSHHSGGIYSIGMDRMLGFAELRQSALRQLPST